MDIQAVIIPVGESLPSNVYVYAVRLLILIDIHIPFCLCECGIIHPSIHSPPPKNTNASEVTTGLEYLA